MKKLLAVLALSLSLILSANADCHGVAVLVIHKVDADHASICIQAIMQCDDASVDKFQSHEAVFDSSTSKEDLAKLILAMAQETANYFNSIGYENDAKDLMQHLQFRDGDAIDKDKTI